MSPQKCLTFNYDHIPGVHSMWGISGHKELKHVVWDSGFLFLSDWADVPPDRTDHHLNELHDDGRFCLPLHLRHCLHQLHNVHCLRLWCLRWGQAKAIFKLTSKLLQTNDYNASFTWAKTLIQTWFNDVQYGKIEMVLKYKCTINHCFCQDDVLQWSQDCLQALLLDPHKVTTNCWML